MYKYLNFDVKTKDEDLAESINRSASDLLSDLVP